MIYSQSTRLSVVGFYCQTKPFSEFDRWTLRFAERYLGQHSDVTGTAISKSTIHRIPQANNLKPHRSTYFLHISDSDLSKNEPFDQALFKPAETFVLL